MSILKNYIYNWRKENNKLKKTYEDIISDEFEKYEFSVFSFT